MMTRLLIVLCALALCAAMLPAGERGAPAAVPAPPTGNLRVDLFAGGLAALPRPDAGLVFQDQDAPGAGAEEKSPWIAGALSLALPGAGEIYSQSYVKGAAFMAAEAVSWIVAYTYNKKGRTQTVDFENFADQHFSVIRYANWTLDNI